MSFSENPPTSHFLSRRDLCRAAVAFAAGSLAGSGEAKTPSSIDIFFRSFTDEWMRQDPNAATASRYFTGPEQDPLERQLTPLTLAWRRERIALARKGLSQLRRFDAKEMTEKRRGVRGWLCPAWG